MKNIAIYAPDIFATDAIGNYSLGLAEHLINHFENVNLFAERFTYSHIIKIQKTNSLFNIDLKDSILFINYSIYDPLLEKILTLDCKK